jgi:autotransporter-associated beta strand protein
MLATVSVWCLGMNVRAGDVKWVATPTDDKLATAGNYTGGVAPVSGDRVFFGTSSVTTLVNDLAADTKLNLLYEGGAGYSYTISGNRIEIIGLNNNNGASSTQILQLDTLLNQDLDVNGNGAIFLNGTLTVGGAYSLRPKLSGTLSVTAIDAGANEFSIGVTQEKSYFNNTNTTYSNTNSVVLLGNLTAGKFNNYNTGQTILTGSNNYTGATWLGDHSYTELRYAADTDRKLSVNQPLLIYSGTLLFSGTGGYRETVSSLQLGRGEVFGIGMTSIERVSGSGQLFINSSAVTNRVSNSVLRVSEDNLVGASGSGAFGAGYSTGTYTSGIAEAWVTVGNNWAVYDSGTQMLQGLATYTVWDDWVNQPFANAGINRTMNVSLTGSGSIGYGANAQSQLSTLKINTDGVGGELNINTGYQLKMFSKGLMFVGADNYTISGPGAIGADSANGFEMYLWQNGAGELDITADMVGFRNIVKTGPGTLVLSGSNSMGTSAADQTRNFMLYGGTVRVNSDYAFDPLTMLVTDEGVLDLNGHDVTVRGVRGNVEQRFTVTNEQENMVDFIVGVRTGDSSTPYTGNASDFYTLGNAVLTGNLRLVLQGRSDTSIQLRGFTHTGGVKLLGNLNGRMEYFTVTVTNTTGFGTAGAPVEFGDNGGFGMGGDFTTWSNPVIVSGSNAFIFSENRTMTSTGKWTGNGDIELRNSWNVYTLAGDMSEFTGTIKSASGPRASTAANKLANRTLVRDTALDSGAATYALWRAADAGNEESQLLTTILLENTTVAAGGSYDVHFGDLVSGNAINSDARMNAGVATDTSTGVVSNNRANSTANLIVGSANHDYSEFAERIIDSGYYNTNTVTLTGILAGAKIAVTKVGTGTWALTGSNSYSGSTTVSGGVLLIDGEGSINSTDRVTVNSGEFRYNSSTALTAATYVEAGGALGGSGVIDSVVYLNDANSTITGGGLGTVGELTFNDWQLWGDFTYVWDILDTTSYDTLTFTDNTYGLQLNGDNYTLTVNNPNTVAVENFVILSGLTSGFDADNWSVTGGYELFLDGTDLVLNTIPEPSTWLLLGTGVALLAFLRRRR